MAGEWQPIATVPKDGEPVDIWLCLSSKPIRTGMRYPNVRWREPDGWYDPDDELERSILGYFGQQWVITHWRREVPPSVNP